NGAIAPGEALSQAAQILDRYVRLFFNVSSQKIATMPDGMGLMRPAEPKAPDARIEELDFSVRTYNCLKKANIQTVADLVKTSEEDLMNIRNFGRKSLVEVQDKLSQFGLGLAGSPGPSAAVASRNGDEEEDEE